VENLVAEDSSTRRNRVVRTIRVQKVGLSISRRGRRPMMVLQASLMKAREKEVISTSKSKVLGVSRTRSLIRSTVMMKEVVGKASRRPRTRVAIKRTMGLDQ